MKISHTLISGGFALLLTLSPLGAAPNAKPAAPVKTAAVAQATFSSAESAIRGLVAAIERGDTGRVLAILGPDGKSILNSGDPVEDKNVRAEFLKIVKERCDIVPISPTRDMFRMGKKNWPFPIPLIKQGSNWVFDTAAGKAEILNRRIGRNELHAIDVCHTYVDAQREYAASVGDGAYAQKFISAAGQKDGLYWGVDKGQKPSPLGPIVASASSEGYSADGKGRPFYGYHFKILTNQGPDAPGGQASYIKDGRMTGGFALVAWPTQYKNSGVMTFIVNQTGVVFQKNLGPQTEQKAAAMTRFDPDATWKPVKMEP